MRHAVSLLQGKMIQNASLSKRFGSLILQVLSLIRKSESYSKVYVRALLEVSATLLSSLTPPLTSCGTTSYIKNFYSLD